MRFFATSVEKNINFSIEHHCPSCGAPVFLDESDRFFVCPYCRVRSCIAQKGFGRYFIPPHKDIPKDVDLNFLPYWRFKGVQYACTPAGVDHWFTDVSCLALAKVPDRVPFSLGVRSQALKLKRVSARTIGNFLRPSPLKESLKALSKRSKSSRALIKEDIGEAVSLIYAPFYLADGQIFDGVLNTSLGKTGAMEELTGKHCRPEKETQILSGICPACGWDLEGQSDSLALICSNCDSLWQPRQDSLAQVRFGSAQPDNLEDVLIPFWKISARVQGMVLDTRRDLMQMANLPGAIHPQTGKSNANQEELNFWAPAFKIRPRVFLRIARQFTIAQPLPTLEKKIRKNTHLPITLPASEAIQSIRIILASLARPLKDHLPPLAKAEIKASAVCLVFMPFESHHHEFIHRELNLAINTNVLKLSCNL